MNYQELHYLLLVAGNYSNKAIVKRMRSQNLMPGQPKILDFLLDHDKCTQKEISKGCVLDKSTVTSLLSRMEKTNLIRKIPCMEDRRNSIVTLTEEGFQKALHVRKICHSVDRQAWEGISEAEKNITIQTLLHIIMNLERME